jgi:hypothetical protein
MEKEIGKINKNETADIVVRIDDFNNMRGLTIREFVTSDRYTGFTKSGVRILAKDFLKFKEMINSIPDEDMKEQETSQEGAEEVPKLPEKQPQEELSDY